MRGIDISNHQTGLIPSTLDIDFCIAKATEGVGFTDPDCDKFIQDCIDNNILWGFYHFARENTPESEAEYFYQETKNYFNHGIPVLDYETSNYNDAEWCERFAKRLYDLSGVWCMIYTSASWLIKFYNSWLPQKCGLWLAGYPWSNPYWTDEEMPYNIYPWEFCAIWQFTSSLIIPGWYSKLDGDIAYMDKEAWYKYANAHSNSGKVQPTLSYMDLAREIILGEWGIGEDRKRMLEERGYNYETAQSMVNTLYEIADEVIEGKWGNGWNREQALNGAGYPYDIIQKIVNEKLA